MADQDVTLAVVGTEPVDGVRRGVLRAVVAGEAQDVTTWEVDATNRHAIEISLRRGQCARLCQPVLWVAALGRAAQTSSQTFYSIAWDDGAGRVIVEERWTDDGQSEPPAWTMEE